MWAKVKEYFSRKFILAVLLSGGGFYIALVKDAEVLYAFATLTGVVLAFYNGSNTAEAILAARHAKKET